MAFLVSFSITDPVWKKVELIRLQLQCSAESIFPTSFQKEDPSPVYPYSREVYLDLDYCAGDAALSVLL